VEAQVRPCYGCAARDSNPETADQEESLGRRSSCSDGADLLGQRRFALS
jgi:hypothetical protein